MFREGTKESTQSEIRLPCVDVEYMKIVLDFLYTGKVTWTKENVHKVSMLGNYFGSKHLVDECSEMIGNYLNEQNCVNILRFADKYNLEKLRVKGKALVLNNFEDVSKSNLDFVKLSFELLIELVGSPLAVICDNNPEENEKQLFKLLWDSIAWMEKEIQRDYVLKILGAVHLPCIGEQYLNYIETKVCFGPKAKCLIEKAKGIPKVNAGDNDWASLRGRSTISFKIITNIQNEDVKYFRNIFLQDSRIEGAVDATRKNSVSVFFYSEVPLKGKYDIKKVGEVSAYRGTFVPSQYLGYEEDGLSYLIDHNICDIDAWKSKVGNADVEIHVTVLKKNKHIVRFLTKA